MYNIGVLNDKEFEELCKELLETKLKVKLQNFKRGRDDGIDLRYSADVENKIIIQAKHYQASKFSKLKNDLFKTEKESIEELTPQPERYIVITSLGLTPGQATEIAEGLKPFVQNTNDIYGLDRIQALLRANKEVVERHYKLWLTSTVVLQRILNNGIQGRSEFYSEKIIRKLSLYVPTKNYPEAVEKLKKNKFVLITGEPGIGKTTISYLLICDLLSKGYQLIYIHDKIFDGEQLFSSDPKKKQIFYFDDFLGANLYEILNPKNSESSIVGFIERIQSSRNKFLILTTRTTILNQAEHNFEKFSRGRFSKISRYEVALKEYSKLDKAKILYNHLYHSSSFAKNIKRIRQNKYYLKIIDHDNYSPRLIEFITDHKNFEYSNETSLLTFIEKNLDNPHEIWKAAYENQLSNTDRFLLTTLFSLGSYHIENEKLQEAFDARIAYETSVHGHVLENSAYENSLKKLLDGFIKSERISPNSHVFSLLNPSIADFLLNYIKARKKEKTRIVYSVIYFEQLTAYFHPDAEDYIPFQKSELDQLFIHFSNNCHKLKFSAAGKSKWSKTVEVVRLYLSYFETRLTANLLKPWVSKFSDGDINNHQLNDTLRILNKIAEYPILTHLIISQWHSIIHKLYKLAKTGEDLESTRLLFDKFGQDFDEYMSSEDNSKLIVARLNEVFSERIYDDPDFTPLRMDSIMEYVRSGNRFSAESSMLQALQDQFSDFITEVGLDDHFSTVFENFHINESAVLDKAIENYSVNDADYDGSIILQEEKLDNELNEIDRLFAK